MGTLYLNTTGVRTRGYTIHQVDAKWSARWTRYAMLKKIERRMLERGSLPHDKGTQLGAQKNAMQKMQKNAKKNEKIQLQRKFPYKPRGCIKRKPPVPA